MNTSNRIQISSDFNRLFAMAADIAQWPHILPHYRWVKILERKNDEVKAEMAARHKGVPLWWRTIQRPLLEHKRIEFTHIGGITKGMKVQWTFDEVGQSCLGPTWLVQIHHQFDPAWPPPGKWFADKIIGDAFVKEVANKTLRKIKEILEL
jgi:ribosome-associated toxin RatA of RatAB toxin-antitoxin module